MLERQEIKRMAEELWATIDKHVHLTTSYSSQGNQLPFGGKIDLVERILELVRIENRYLENNLPMEEFLQGTVAIRDDALQFVFPETMRNVGSGTAPKRLQPKLLLFLLFRHNRGYYEVYDIIESFIKTVWDNLEVLDLKKTKTGVIRCYTNTRFAANTLRKYGLLKFTRREAYRTWVLSLPGFLVASKLMEKVDWSLPPLEKEPFSELHPDIRKAFDDLQTYDEFVKRLASVCKPETRVFDEFKEGSSKAYSLLREYWRILNDRSLSKSERDEKRKHKLRELEQNKDIESFYDQFSALVKVGDSLSLRNLQ